MAKSNATSINSVNKSDPMQKPQSPMDKQDGVYYDNDVADGWLRGSGDKAAEAKPGYDLTGRHKVSR